MADHDQLRPAITAEQEDLANKLIGAMAGKFAVPAAEFDLVLADEASPQLAVAYAARYALTPDTAVRLGRLSIPTPRTKWGIVFLSRSQEKYIVEVDGEQYDTRTGMSFKVYEAMVKRARERGDDVPDDGYVSARDGYGSIPVRCATFLSEAPFSDGVEDRARIGRVSMGGERVKRDDIVIASSTPGFRPAVLLR